MASANDAAYKHMPLEYQTETGRLNILGFWVFLGAEVALFSTLFAAYFVLLQRTNGDVTMADVFSVESLLIQTFILLTSSFTCGLAIHEMRGGRLKGTITWLVVTILLGGAFLYFEIEEFLHFIHEGANIGTSAYWSSFFLLAGTHGAHVVMGILWIVGILIQLSKRGLTPVTARKVFISSLYWHFLDVVWIFLFTGVYLGGLVLQNG